MSGRLAKRVASPADIPDALAALYEAAVSGIPGAAYLDLPSDSLMADAGNAAAAVAAVERLTADPRPPPVQADPSALEAAAALIRTAKK